MTWKSAGSMYINPPEFLVEQFTIKLSCMLAFN